MSHVNPYRMYPTAPARPYHLNLPDLIDLDGSRPQWTQHPSVKVTIKNPTSGRVITLHGVDSIVRTNNFDQRSQTCEIVLNNLSDWVHANGKKPIHSMSAITVREGYRGLTARVFEGVVTDADYSNYPEQLRLSCSDALYFLGQFYILSSLHYEDWAADDAIRDIMGRAGITPNMVNIGADGTQALAYGLLPKTNPANGKNGAVFAYQKGDVAVGHICDMFGWRYWCDVGGHIEVQYVRPFPESSPTSLPALPAPGETRRRHKLYSAKDAAVAYGNTALTGNLLKVISHKLTCSDMRNFIGVYDGFNQPTYYDAAPAIPGFPKPVNPTPKHTSGAALAATHNSTHLAYYTSAAMIASDLIAWNATVKTCPDNPAVTTTDTMQNFIKNRIGYDLNRETEALEVLTFGNPYVDLGQTVYVKDTKSYVDGNFLIVGYQTRMSGSGYTTQLKCVGGTPQTCSAKAPRPRPHTEHRKGHDAIYRLIIARVQSYINGDGSTASWALTPATGS